MKIEPKHGHGAVVLGLLGGIASGKSLVADFFRQMGGGVLDADRMGHQVLTEPEVKAALVGRWGSAILDSDGKIKRSAVAAIVFAPPPDGPPELAWLERLTHPRIGWRIHEEACLQARAGKPLLVLDAPVMLKAGWNDYCDRIVYVDAPDEVRLQRAMKRGWSKEVFSAREAAQESLTEKRRSADFVIDNSGSPEATRRQVECLWRQLLG